MKSTPSELNKLRRMKKDLRHKCWENHFRTTKRNKQYSKIRKFYRPRRSWLTRNFSSYGKIKEET